MPARKATSAWRAFSPALAAKRRGARPNSLETIPALQGASLKRIYTTAMAVSAALLLAGAAHAQVTLNSVRIGAKDTVALAKFYQAAFGMQEVNRINGQGGPEIFVNFGATLDAAKANKSQPIVIMHRDSDDVKDPIAHVILNVKDM